MRGSPRVFAQRPVSFLYSGNWGGIFSNSCDSFELS
jgi:hypothetical protein